MEDNQADRWFSQQAAALVVVMLALASLACTLGTKDSGNPAQPRVENPPQFFTPVPTNPIIIPSATPYATSTPQPTWTPTNIPCQMQSNWPVYTVQTGDTLARIAARAGSTVYALTYANCLANPNYIYPGQQLFVPMIPATSTPPAPPTATTYFPPAGNPNAPVFLEALTVERHWSGPAGQWVTYSGTVRVDAGEVTNALRVDFFVNNQAAGTTYSIGSDSDPWDGAFVDYNFPAPGVYTFRASAANETLSTQSTVFTIRYDPNFSPPEGQYNLLSVMPHRAFDGAWYTLGIGETVVISWAQAPPGALYVDFRLTPTGTQTSSAATIIGTDVNPADGTLITWLVPQGAVGHLEAVAVMPDGSEQHSRITNVIASQ